MGHYYRVPWWMRIAVLANLWWHHAQLHSRTMVEASHDCSPCSKRKRGWVYTEQGEMRISTNSLAWFPGFCFCASELQTVVFNTDLKQPSFKLESHRDPSFCTWHHMDREKGFRGGGITSKAACGLSFRSKTTERDTDWLGQQRSQDISIVALGYCTSRV